jgi:hypothetical protein
MVFDFWGRMKGLAFIVDERAAQGHDEALLSIQRLDCDTTTTTEVHVLHEAGNEDEDYDDDLRPGSTTTTAKSEHLHHHHGEVDLSLVTSQAVIHVPANMEFALPPATWAALEADMQAKCELRNRFALASRMRYHSKRLVLGMLWLGFLPVLAVLDWWRGLCSLWGYHCPGDLRVETLTTTYPSRKRVEADTPWFHCCCSSRYAVRRAVANKGAHLVQHVRQGEELNHLCHTVRTHPHLTWTLAQWPVPVFNCWWVPAFTVYYYLFALPWWNWLANRLITGYVPAIFAHNEMLRTPFAILYHWPLSRFWWPVLVLHLLFVVLPITTRRMHLGPWWQTLVYLALYPLYLTASPLLWFVIKVSG